MEKSVLFISHDAIRAGATMFLINFLRWFKENTDIPFEVLVCKRGEMEGDFEKLAPYEGELGRMESPALILWGENDPFVPVTGAERFNREISDSKLVVLPEASHFLYDDEPERCASEVVAFLADKR